MQRVDIYIGTSLRGPAKGEGRVIYTMKTKRGNGADYESLPSMAAYQEATEARLVLYALRDALRRMNYACEVMVHTESAYIASAIQNRWHQEWRAGGWKNSKGREVKDSALWGDILNELEEGGHELEADAGKHEYSEWMRWKMELSQPLYDVFTKIRGDEG